MKFQNGSILIDRAGIIDSSKFTFSNLEKADLRDANLQDAVLYKSRLNTANLGETNLTGASNGFGLDYFNNPNTKGYTFKLSLGI